MDETEFLVYLDAQAAVVAEMLGRPKHDIRVGEIEAALKTLLMLGATQSAPEEQHSADDFIEQLGREGRI